jgi:hypothetical protein
MCMHDMQGDMFESLLTCLLLTASRLCELAEIPKCKSDLQEFAWQV